MVCACASEAGAVFIPPDKVVQKGRLKPGRVLLVNTQEGRIVDDKELKLTTARSKPFAAWIIHHFQRSEHRQACQAHADHLAQH